MIIICLFSGNGFAAFLFLLWAFADENFGKENVASSKKRRRKEVKKILLSKFLNDPLNKKLSSSDLIKPEIKSVIDRRRIFYNYFSSHPRLFIFQ